MNDRPRITFISLSCALGFAAWCIFAGIYSICELLASGTSPQSVINQINEDHD